MTRTYPFRVVHLAFGTIGGKWWQVKNSARQITPCSTPNNAHLGPNPRMFRYLVAKGTVLRELQAQTSSLPTIFTCPPHQGSMKVPIPTTKHDFPSPKSVNALNQFYTAGMFRHRDSCESHLMSRLAGAQREGLLPVEGPINLGGVEVVQRHHLKQRQRIPRGFNGEGRDYCII